MDYVAVTVTVTRFVTDKFMAFQKHYYLLCQEVRITD